MCGDCGIVMSVLLQLVPGPWIPRIPKERVLFVFKCEADGVCEFWEADDVANRCLLVPTSELARQVEAPQSVVDGDTRILPRLWVSDWIRSDDGLDPELAAAIADPHQYSKLPEEIQQAHGFQSENYTKAGGAPNWTGNGPSADPPPPRKLLFQIDNFIHVTDPEAAPVYFDPDDQYTYVSGNSVQSANFMSDGVAYIFDTAPDAPVPVPKLRINR